MSNLSKEMINLMLNSIIADLEDWNDKMVKFQGYEPEWSEKFSELIKKTEETRVYFDTED